MLAALRSTSDFGDYFSEGSGCHSRVVATIGRRSSHLLLEEDGGAWPAPVWSTSGEALGLPVLPSQNRQYDHLPGPDVRGSHFYFVSNGAMLEKGGGWRIPPAA